MQLNLTDSDLDALVTEAQNRGWRNPAGPEANLLLLKSRIRLGKVQQLEQLTAKSQALGEQINQLKQMKVTVSTSNSCHG